MIQQVLTDMVFRGDLRPTKNSLAQNELRNAVKKNDLEKFKQVIEQSCFFSPLSAISMFPIIAELCAPVKRMGIDEQMLV